MTNRRAQLIAALRSIGGASHAADTIHHVMLDVMAEKTSRGHDIGADTAYYARPRKKAKGPVRDLQDTRRAARKAIARGLSLDHDWVDAWARLPADTRRLIRLPRRILTEDGRAIDYMGYQIHDPEFAIIVPRPELALPGIEAVLLALARAPGAKHRIPNQVEDRARTLIWHAFKAGNGGGARTTAFLEFGRTIDRIYGTNLFGAEDGRHFRRLSNGP
jgi:hypothetical protein